MCESIDAQTILQSISALADLQNLKKKRQTMQVVPLFVDQLIQKPGGLVSASQV
jgi:hypothetical protein